MEAAFGSTPDISNLLVFTWYQPVLYHVHNAKFLNSRELAGRFVGIAENMGDTLTFWVVTNDTRQIIARSVVRAANEGTPNLHSVYDKDEVVDAVLFDDEE